MRCTTGRSAYSQLAVPEKRKGDSRLGISSSYSYSPGVDVPEWSGSSQIWWLDKSSSFSKSAILLVGDTKRRVLAVEVRTCEVVSLAGSSGARCPMGKNSYRYFGCKEILRTIITLSIVSAFTNDSLT